jgi:phosphatidylserine/phosphatidylglycerophosphate/cardiolipin synthase-like enzyme
MDDAELVGGVLLDAADPKTAATVLAGLLKVAAVERAEVRRAGFDPELLDVLRRQFSRRPTTIDQACAEGAAWVLGRRSATAGHPWELVASLPPGVPLPTGLRRTTGETIVHLVNGSRRSIRLVAPFIDETGLRFLGDGLAAATVRGIEVEVFLPTRSTRAAEALSELLARIERDGNPEHLRVAVLRRDAPWAHLKVVTADSTSAYIGSANVTGPGLAGLNLEMGVLVHGQQVRTVERILDLFRDTTA